MLSDNNKISLADVLYLKVGQYLQFHICNDFMLIL
jgi:hypothetical protein